MGGNIRLLWYIPGFEPHLLRPCSIRALAIGKALTRCNEISFVGIVSPQINVTIQLSDKFELISLSKNPLLIFSQLINIVKDKDINLVQERLGCHYLFSDWGIIAGNYMGLPIIGELHEYPPTFISKVLANIRLKHSLKICDILFVINKTILQHLPLQQEELKKTLKKVFLIPNGYDATIFNYLTNIRPERATFSINKKLVGYFGDLNENKGVNVILDLIQHVNNHFFFLIAGRGQLEKDVKRLSQAFPNKCRYLGYLRPQEVYFLMSVCDATVALYPQWFKKGWPQYNNPLKVYESLAMGTPVVISEPTLPMLPQEIANLCVVVSGTNLKELFDALDVACRRKADKASMSAVMRKYSWDHIANNILIPIYEKLTTNVL